MAHTDKLPNGFVMNNVPDDATQAQIASRAVSKGYAQPQDFAEYPDIYRSLGVAPSAFESALGATPEMIANVNDIAQTAGSKVEHTARNLAGGLVIPAAGELSLLPRIALDSGINSAFSGVTAEAENLAEGKNNDVGSAMAWGAAVPVAVHAAAPVGGALFNRFSPRVAATAKGLDDAGALERGEGDEIIRDTPPSQVEQGEPVRGESDPVKTVEQGADRARAEQALIDQDFMEHATRLHSSIEGTSYAGGALKAAKTGQAGSEAKDALDFYRQAIAGYESGVLPHMGGVEGFEHLKGAPYYEALMRSDVGELDNLIGQIDAGIVVDPAHFLNALEAYQVQAQSALNAFIKKQPQVWVSGLEDLLREFPDIDSLVSEAARMGLAPEKMSQKMVTDYQQAFVSSVKDGAEKMEGDLSKKADEYRVEANKLLRETRNNPRLKAVVTAMNHSADTMDKMAADVADAMANGRMKSGEDWSGIGMLRSMAATHGLPDLEQLYQRYRALRSGFNAMPEARAKMDKTPFTETMSDALETILTVKTLGANKAVKKVLKKPVSKAIAKPVERVRRKVRRRQALSEVNDLISKSKGE